MNSKIIIPLVGVFALIAGLFIGGSYLSLQAIGASQQEQGTTKTVSTTITKTEATKPLIISATTVIVNTNTITRSTNSGFSQLPQNFTHQQRFHLGDEIYRERSLYYFYGFDFNGHIVIGTVASAGGSMANMLVPNTIGQKFYLGARMFQVLAYDEAEGVLYLAW